MFIHLENHSSYSLSRGSIRVKELASTAADMGMPAVAITDTNNLFAALEFALEAIKKGVQPIIGIQLDLLHNDTKHRLTLIAKNEEGFQNLLKLNSEFYIENENYVELEYLKSHSAGIFCLAGAQTSLAYHEDLKAVYDDNFFIKIMRTGGDQFEKKILELAEEKQIPLVATNDNYFWKEENHEAEEALLCIAEGRYLTEDDRPTISKQQYFKSMEAMEKLFADIPSAIENTVNIAKSCTYYPKIVAPMLPSFPCEEGRTEEDELRAVAEQGLKERLNISEITEEFKHYFERLDYELGIINRMEFPGYFLIVSDFIRWAKEQDIPVGPGRGSGAGSVVAWALQITDLDPIRYGLLFERFLNPERVSMPDFDIDFCQERRDEVILYVQDRYGKSQVAQIITFGKLQARAVIRDVGRVLQMPYGQVDRISKLIPFNPIDPVTLQKAYDMDPEFQKEAKMDSSVAKLIDIGLKLEGMHRHASTHAAGVVIGSKDLDEIVPLYSDGKSEMPVTQYSMVYCELAGLVKFDFLGLKTLTTIQKAVKLANAKGNNIDINNIPIDDKASFEMLAKGESTGVFQMESSGMRDAMRKMRPDCIEDIIALISLYRPGPMENIPTYNECKHGTQKPDYKHPKLKPCLEETYGVIIYQEQVMEIAKILAGYSLGKADLLRRAMGKKKVEEMAKQRVMFQEGCAENDISKEEADKYFDLIEKFAGYGFNKSHAAAYAMIGYQTAYLKAHYPVEFFIASMNMDIGDSDKLSIFTEATRRAGIEILPPDINRSSSHFKEENGKIRYALGALKNVSVGGSEELVRERDANGSFTSLQNLASRITTKSLNKRSIESLAKVGAFEGLEPNRAMMFENAPLVTDYANNLEKERNSDQNSLFGGGAAVEAEMPLKLREAKEWNDAQKVNAELEAYGFFLMEHPLEQFEHILKRHKITNAGDLVNLRDGEQKITLAGVVLRSIHRFKGKKRFSYIYISDRSGTVEVSIFNEQVLDASRDYLDNKQPILVQATARKDEGGTRIFVDGISPLKAEEANIKRKITIHLNSKGALDSLESKLSALPAGNDNLFYFLDLEEEIGIRFKYNKRLKYDPNVIEEVEKLDCVSKVEVS